MHRRARALPALALAVATAAAACSPSAPPLTDPVEILTKSAEALTAARTVHLEASVDGSVNLDLMGTGQGAAMALEGTKVVGDVDIEEGDVQFHVEVPAMLGFTADVIVVGDETFLKSSMTGPTWTRSPLGGAGIPLDPGDPAASLADLAELLKRPEIGPQKLDDTQCGGESCYQVAIDLTPEELLNLGGDLSGVPMGETSLHIQVLVEKDSLRMSTIVLNAIAGNMGDLTVTIAMSKWDEGLDIGPPPADQVQ